MWLLDHDLIDLIFELIFDHLRNACMHGCAIGYADQVVFGTVDGRLKVWDAVGMRMSAEFSVPPSVPVVIDLVSDPSR